VAAERGTYRRSFVATTDLNWLVRQWPNWQTSQVGLHFIPPGGPWRNGYVESFNSRMRGECPNINSFWSLAHARMVISDWKYDYNHHRRRRLCKDSCRH
jgi:putative transposase